jgi:hypothetical protein
LRKNYIKVAELGQIAEDYKVPRSKDKAERQGREVLNLGLIVTNSDLFPLLSASRSCGLELPEA